MQDERSLAYFRTMGIQVVTLQHIPSSSNILKGNDLLAWKLNKEWFDTHIDEFLKDEFIIVKNQALLLRTKNETLALDVLHHNGDRTTLFNRMADNGRVFEQDISTNELLSIAMPF